MPEQFATAHLDGYRIATETIESGPQTHTNFYLDYVQAGTRVSRAPVTSMTCETLLLVEQLPLIERRRKLLAAMARFFNEGGDRDELQELYVAAQHGVARHYATIGVPPVCIEAEETHARTFRLPDGRYLRIVEDEFSEVMTVAEMAMAMDDDINAAESSGFDFIP